MTSPSHPLPASEATELAHALAQLSAHGLPMADGLRALADDVPQRRMRRVLLDVADALARGQSLEQSLAAQQGALPATLVGLVRAGANSGRLPELLEEYLLVESQAAELRRRMWVALAYPLFLSLFCLAVFSFVEMAVIPQMRGLMASSSSILTSTESLPRVSKFLIQLSQSYPAFLTGAALGAIVLAALFRFALPGGVRARLRQHIPLVGPVLRWTAWAHFCDITALLLEHQVPLPQALRMAGDGVGNLDVSESAGRLAEDVASGASLRTSFNGRMRIPPSLFELISGAESQGTLSAGFRMAARMASARAKLQGGLVLLVAPWFGFVAIALLVVICALAMFLPMIGLFRLL